MNDSIEAKEIYTMNADENSPTQAVKHWNCESETDSNERETQKGKSHRIKHMLLWIRLLKTLDYQLIKNLHIKATYYHQ